MKSRKSKAKIARRRIGDRAFKFSVGVAMLAVAAFAAPAAGAGVDARERALLEALVRGEEARELARELAARPRPARSWRGAERRSPAAGLAATLGELERAVERGSAGSAKRAELERAAAALREHDREQRGRFAEIRARLVAAGTPADVVSRLDEAERLYAERLGPLLGQLDESTLASEQPTPSRHTRTVELVRELRRFDVTAAAAPLLRALALPYRPEELAPRSPETSPTITPSYASPTPAPPTTADLAATVEAPLSAEILAQAEAFGFDYVRIYEFVRNEIDGELYAGSLKGAGETLRQRRGNDVDQASLLIALFRASGLPCRYVRGVVERPVAALASELGLADPAAIAQALARSGVPSRPVVRGGKVAAFEVEHTWVAAYAPYGNYRGSVVDFSGKTWIPLAPALAGYERTPASRVLTAMGFDAGVAVADGLAAPHDELPLDRLRREVGVWLGENRPGESYETQLGARNLLAERLSHLPSSLPGRVVAVVAESNALSASQRHIARFRIFAGTLPSDALLLDRELAVAVLLGRRLTVSYLPATVDDHRTVLLFGGLGRVPAYLVHVRPIVRVDGREVAVGESLPLAVAHRIEIELAGPWGNERIAQTLVSGSYQAFALGGPAFAQRSDLGGDPADAEQLAARLLSAVAHRYGERWDAAEAELAGLFDVAVTRPLPSVVAAANAVEVTTLAGIPERIEWRGVTLDAALRVADPLARSGDAAEARDFLRLSALHGSALEHAIFEELFLADAISADRGLGVARAAAIAVESVDAGNVATLLPLLDFAPAVESEIERWALAGATVEVPQTEISRNTWSGVVFRVDDPATGAAGYFLSGRLAGGSTTEAPGSWILQFLADALAAPYAGEPNGDPLAAAAIAKLPGSDGQEGEVGELLESPLAVVVRDIAGRAIQGAEVTFRTGRAGGLFEPDDETQVSALTVLTDREGVAAVPFRLATDTSLDPVYRLREPDVEHPSRALAHTIEAEVAAYDGAIALTDPLLAFAFPGPLAEIRRTDTEATTRTIDAAGIWVDTMHLVAEDSYGNPIANEPLVAQASDGTRDASCSNPLADPLPAALFVAADCPVLNPLLGQCGATLEELRTLGAAASRTELRTRAEGVELGVISGNTVATAFDVTVAGVAEADPPVSQLRFLYDFLFDHESATGNCSGSSRLRFFSRYLSTPEGGNAQAVSPGELYPQRAEIAARLPFPANWPRPLPCPADYDKPPASLDVVWIEPELTEEVPVELSNGGSATAALQRPDGMLESELTAGATTAFDALRAVGRVHWNWRELYEECGQDLGEQLAFDLDDPIGTGVWAATTELEPLADSPLRLNDDARLSSELSLGYRIEPADYVARSAEVVLLQDGEELATGVGSSRQGTGFGTVQRGFPFDVERVYEAQLVLNRGTAAELRSQPLELPVAQRLFSGLDRRAFFGDEIGVVHQNACQPPMLFHFTTAYEASVTLKFRGIYRIANGGFEHDGSEVEVVAERTYARGAHDVEVPREALPPGEYEWELVGVSAIDGHVEIERGFARYELVVRDALPVGHTLVDGVDVFDGHLIVSRQDFRVPARGIDLAFERTFSSNALDAPGPLGPGWTHNWDSSILITPCGEVIVIGSEGSGMTFVDDGEGGLKPLPGYHGTLVANPLDSSFDFYAKSGRRFHYVPDEGNRWRLAFVEDPNGNRVTLTYEPSSGPRRERLAAVTDPAGRKLALHYERSRVPQFEGDLLTAVDGPGGLRVDFAYDPVWGTLARAAREPHAEGIPSRVESYRSELRENTFDDRPVLVAVRDELSGAETSYEYAKTEIGAGGVVVPQIAVTAISKPRSGVKRFSHDLSGLLARAAETETVVVDERDKTWRYVQNRYGATLRSTDPANEATTFEWAPDDIVMTARTDSNGVRTDFTYDSDGNLLSETTAVMDVDGGLHTHLESTTYAPPASFALQIKERPATRTDRNGNTTTYSWDARGNLLEERIAVRDVDLDDSELTIAHTYLANGDRATTTDRRGETTGFRYDAYGNRTEVIDPLGHATVTAYDVRGRPISVTDPRGNTTRFEYDTLDRRTRTQHPIVSGEFTPAEERVTYDDGALTRTEIDARFGSTVTRFDREGNVIEVIDAEGNRKLFSYNLAGNKTLETSWFGGATARFDTTFVYDDVGRLVTRFEPEARRTDYGYDAVGNLLVETLTSTTTPGPDETVFVPRVTEHRYDALNRRIETSRHLGGERQVTQTLLDGNGNAVAVTDPLGRVTTLDYDALDRRIRESGPQWRPGRARVNEWLYDGNGNVIEERRRNERELPGGGWEAADQIRTKGYDERNLLVRAEDALGKVVTYEYDEAGNLAREVDRRGALVSYGYDERNRRIRRTEVLSRFTTPARNVVTEWNYDGNTNLVEERLANGNVVSHGYDELNRRTSSEDALGELATIAYDARGNATRSTDANGNVTTRVFDALDRLREEHLPESRSFVHRYDVAGNRIATTNARGHTTRFEYDPLNRRTKSIDPEPFGYEMSYSYDLANNKLTETNRRGFTTRFAYDDLDRLTTVTDPPLSPSMEGFSQTFTYDAIGNQLSATDRRGILTRFTYDLENRRLTTTRASLTVETNQYDANGNRIFVADANGHKSGFEFDERNLLKAENRPLAAITRFVLDDMGDRVQRTDPENRVTEWGYDLRRRQRSETRKMLPSDDGDDEAEVSCYDGNGNRIARYLPAVVAALGLSAGELCASLPAGGWRYGYDAANRLVSVADPLLHETTYGYDGSGNRTSQTDANGHATRFEYDALERLTRKIYPEVEGVAAAESYGYDPNGNRTSLVDPKGQALAWEYDALDRETLASYPLPTPARGDELLSIATTYDANANPLQVVETRAGPLGDETRTTLFTYDPFDHVLTKTDPWDKKLTYGYDPAGKRVRLTDPDGKTTLYGYDALNRLTAATLPDGAGVTNYEYLRNSLLRRISYPNSATATHSYDLANRIQKIENRQFTAISSSYEYTYDENGNRIQQVEQNGGVPETTTYEYDDADRLTLVVYPDKTVDYTLDGVGNRTNEVTTDAATATVTSSKLFVYNERDWLTSVSDSTNPANDTTYAYDVNGNQIARTQGGVTTGYVYDTRDQLVEVQTDGMLVESYDFSYDGLRTRKSGGGGLFRYVYDGRSLLLEADLAGNTISRYEWGSDRLLSLNHATEGRSFYLFDALGSPVSLSKPDGTLRARYLWDAWGNLRSEVGASSSTFGFTGYQRDEATGLLYARNRYYDPELGRFISADPLEYVDGPNVYAYARNNPLAYTDPMGLCSIGDVFTNTDGCLGYFAEGWNEGWQEDKGAVSTTLSFAPGLGELKDAQEAITGVDYVGGERLSWGQRLTTLGAAAIPFLPGKVAREAVSRVADVFGKSADDVAEKVVRESSSTPGGTLVPATSAPNAAAVAASGGIEISLKRPPGVTDAQWQAKLDALNSAAAEGRAKVVHQPVRSGAAQRQARAEGRISPGDDADHGLDLQFGGQDVPEEIISTSSTVNRSVGAQGQQRLLHPDGTPITCFKEKCP